MAATRIRRFLFGVMATCLAAAPAFADSARDVLASGNGASRDAAIVAALLAGARQIPSLATTTEPVLRPLFESWVRDEARLPVDRTGYKRRMSPAIDSAAGIIRDYEVLAVTRAAASEWRADLRITLADFEVRAASGRVRVSTFLLPFSLHAEEEAEAGGMDAQAAALREREEIDLLRERVGAALGPGLVEVRRADKAVMADPRLGLAFDSPVAVPWKELAAVLGNDYFVAVDIEDHVLEFRPANPRKKEPAYWKARFVLGWRIIAAPDAVVVASGRLRLDRADAELHAATRVETAGSDPARAVPAILDVAARRLARQLEERLVPVQVLATAGDTVTLDTGAVALLPGDRLAVLGTGLVEREEGAALPVHLDGPRVAVLETLTVAGQRAEARVIRGNAATLLPGAPVRRLADLPVPRMP
ncbi:MAG: hypothetical protein K0S46_2354 [Moraxellaceae bacterium]|jgi:hypothetical protein|nr:hypothetical protein [Moraxellaceae bacterium]